VFDFSTSHTAIAKAITKEGCTGSKKDEVLRGCENLHNEEIHKLHFSRKTIT
jgi:hypothetical protein